MTKMLPTSTVVVVAVAVAVIRRLLVAIEHTLSATNLKSDK
jgi:hypothetical protein